MVQFGEFLKNWSLRSKSDTRQVDLNTTKFVEKAKIQKFKNSNATFFSDFQTLWCVSKLEFE